MDIGGGGWWGADRGSRKHKGIDLSTNIGDAIYAPIDGKVVVTKTKISANLNSTKILGTGDYEGYTVYLFYIKPETALINKIVKRGEKVGIQQDLSADYPEKVTDHVHFEIRKGKERINPERGKGITYA